MRIKITADSTCDLTSAQLEKHSIGIVPLIIVKGEREFKDGIDISQQEVFDYFQAGRRLCSTSALNIADYTAVFAEYAKDADAVLHFSLSSGFSGTCQNAAIAAAEFDNVFVVDTKNLSTGSGLLVLRAAELAKEGLSAAEIISRLPGLIDKVEASFVVDTLEYLSKGGRCSSVTALATGLLKIKPCIEVVDGLMKVGKKYRGSLEHCVCQYVEDRLQGRTDIDTARIFLTHTIEDRATIEKIYEIIRRTQHFEEIIENTTGCTVSSHCGPGTLGVLFMRK